LEEEDKELWEGVRTRLISNEPRMHYLLYTRRGDWHLDVFRILEVILGREPSGRYYAGWIHARIDQGSEWAGYSLEERKAIAERVAEAFNDAAAVLNIPVKLTDVECSGKLCYAVLETPFGRCRGSEFYVEMHSGVPVVSHFAVVKVEEKLARRLHFLNRYDELLEQELEKWLKALEKKLSDTLGGMALCQQEYETSIVEGQLIRLDASKVKCSTKDGRKVELLLPRVTFWIDVDLSNLAWGTVTVSSEFAKLLTEEELARLLDEESRRAVERLVRAVALMKRHPDPVVREHAHFLLALIEKAYYDATGETLTS
jgi:hypothetical protein